MIVREVPGDGADRSNRRQYDFFFSSDWTAPQRRLAGFEHETSVYRGQNITPGAMGKKALGYLYRNR